MEKNSGDSKTSASSETGSSVSDVLTCCIPWSAPLVQFQVDTAVYRPKPTLYGPQMLTNIGLLTLEWQLSISQHPKEAKVNLHFRSREIPNLGVNYSTFLVDKSGKDVKLSSSLRHELAESAEKTPGAALKRLIHDNGILHLKVLVKLSRTRFHPINILDVLIAKELVANAAVYKEGEVGKRLWDQVFSDSEKEVQNAQRPRGRTDVVFQCPDGVQVHAHRAVLAALSPTLKAQLERSPSGQRILIASNGISAAAIKEVLHFLYLRRPSNALYKADLGEVLAAAALLHQPALLKLQVEKLLTLCLQPHNALRLWKLALANNLAILSNMIRTVAADRPDLKASLDAVRQILVPKPRSLSPNAALLINAPLVAPS